MKIVLPKSEKRHRRPLGIAFTRSWLRCSVIERCFVFHVYQFDKNTRSSRVEFNKNLYTRKEKLKIWAEEYIVAVPHLE